MLELDQQLTLFLNGSESLYLDRLALTATHTLTWLPAGVVLLYVLIRNNTLRGVVATVLGLAFCILVADQVASGVCKPLFARFRPTNDPMLMYVVDVADGYRGGRYGFFSSHAANTMAVATFIHLLVRSRSLAFWMYSWALLNCWTRAYLGVHYVGDLLAGTLWGLFTGRIVYAFTLSLSPHLRDRRLRASAHPEMLTAGGYAPATTRFIEATLALSYLFIAFRSLFVMPC